MKDDQDGVDHNLIINQSITYKYNIISMICGPMF